MNIKKRNNQTLMFEREKIKTSIQKNSDKEIKEIEKILNNIEKKIKISTNVKSTLDIREMVELELMRLGYLEVAKSYNSFKKSKNVSSATKGYCDMNSDCEACQ